ncbi:MAG TPA: hypothetical protein VMB03_17520 [Bryobacteraceae bacterium]|nr:hypothetical protein [Bryobacteraceae bacterium]
MKKALVLAASLISAAGLWGQEIRLDFQDVVTLPAPGPEGAQRFNLGPVRRDGVSRQTVTGRPVSGTEEHKSTQTLSDGTVISNSTSDGFYRDSAGRTRVDSGGEVTIFDPIAHQTIVLMTEAKKARVMPMPEIVRKMGQAYKSEGPVITRDFTYTTTVGTTTATATVAAGAERGIRIEDSENVKKEDLGVESLNGTLATHTRSTLTIPQGQIGNDRDIHIVNEQWYSDDLQMLVKTANSDPRFGENTYEFTNISRDEPDPSLFQIPADYTIIDLGPTRVKK